MDLRIPLIVFAMGAGFTAVAADLEMRWSASAQSNLYAPPLVADINPSPGEETILSDSEARRLRCIDAQGKQLWEYDGHWKKRLTSAASLSASARPGKSTLIIGNADGSLNCIDAETGRELWQKEIGSIEWGAAIWADLNGDGRDEIVAGTENALVALNADGEILWKHEKKDGKPIQVRCPIAAADVDGDRKAEVFAVGRFGPFCLNGDGTLRWETLPGDDFNSAPVIADADGDGNPELYCCSSNDHAVWSFDARTGRVIWRAPMFGGTDTYPGSGMAVGDIDQDGKEEILVADMLGNVYCLDASGERRWVFQTEKRTHATVSLGDVDGDERIEVLVASGDHYLYCLDRSGVQKWRYKTDLRLVSPATIADVDGDGKTDILVCGSDKTLRCLALGGRYRPELIPWPSRRFDPAQSGSCYGKRHPREAIMETKPLFAHGGFETAKDGGKPDDYPAGSDVYESRTGRPRGWAAEGGGAGAWDLDETEKLDGARSLKTQAADRPLEVATDLIEVDPILQSVSATVWTKGSAAPTALLRWQGLQGKISEQALTLTGDEPSNGWRCVAAKDVNVPLRARWLQMVLVAGPNETLHWDKAEIVGHFRSPRTLQAMINQVGYDVGAPKRFTAQSNFVAKEAAFAVVTPDGATVFSGALKHEGRIHGAYGNDWGFEYWRGDFSAFDTPGKYRVKTTLDGIAETSWPFEIGQDLLWEKTARPAYRFFYYQRCGIEIPGFHKACHLDDAVWSGPDGKRQHELWGGWHDAGDYNKYQNAPYVLRLANAYDSYPEACDRQDADANGRSDFLDEIVWGGEHVRRMIAPDGSAYGGITSGYGFWGPPELETDNVPNTGDERPISGAELGNDSAEHTAAMAKIARYVPDKAPWVEAAERGLNYALAKGQRGPLQFLAAFDLYRATRDEKHAALAKELLPTAIAAASGNAGVLNALREYDALYHEDHVSALRDAILKRADDMIQLAENPFGVYTFGPKEKPNFFGTPAEGGAWHVGTSSRLLEAVAATLQAYQFAHDPKYLAFAYDQFNWTLGNNPYNISLMEGCGSAFPPSYHHRYAFSGVPRGAVPGSIVNGITWRTAGDDRPGFDIRGLDIANFESNEVWLPHNTAYIEALVNLQRAREQK